METDRPIQPAATVEAGLEALAQGDWEGARSAFSDVVQVDGSPEALEGLGMAAWWLEDGGAAIEARLPSLSRQGRPARCSEASAGDAAVIPPGHDAWIVGDEPCVWLEFAGADRYAVGAPPGR
jgi:hypothetical protein